MSESRIHQPLDLGFLEAVRNAASAQTNPQQHELAGAELAAILRDPARTIGASEREALARLVTGAYAKAPTKQEIGVGSSKISSMLETFDTLRAQGMQLKAAESLAAEQHSISVRTIRVYRQRRNERLKAIAAATNKTAI